MAKKATRSNRAKSSQQPSQPLAESNWTLATVSQLIGFKGKAVWNTIMSLGPLALSIWPAASRNLLKHQLGKEALSGWRRALDLENDNFAAVEKKLLDRISKADTEEMIEIESKLNFLGAKRRQMGVVAKALAYVSESSEITDHSGNTTMATEVSSEESRSSSSQNFISPHWMDQFTHLAQQHNEPWRAELLARMLADEASNPGCISPRVLFTVGTLEEDMFQQFVIWLNHTSKIGLRRMVIATGDLLLKRLELPSLAKDECLGYLRTRLGDIGLVGGYGTMSCDSRADVVYADRCVTVTPESGKVDLVGFWCTSVGETLAKYHHFVPTELGHEIFDKWLSEIDLNKFTVTTTPPRF